MTLPFLIAGLILDFAGSHWFSGAGTVGLILTIFGILGIVVQLAFLVFAGWVISQK